MAFEEQEQLSLTLDFLHPIRVVRILVDIKNMYKIYMHFMHSSYVYFC